MFLFSDRIRTSTLLLALLAGAPAAAQAPAATDQQLADTLAEIVREAIPKTYEKKKDWGRTKNITTGLKTNGPVYKLRIHRRKKAVSHGTWKHYRIHFVNPDEKLRVVVDKLRSLEGGGVGMTLVVDAQLEGWAQMRHYNRGIHLLTLTSEGSSTLRLEIDCEVRLQFTKEGMALDPQVTAARLELYDFDLTRFGEAKGELAHGLGKGMKRVMEDQLEGPKLTAKLNRAIDKKRDRLMLSPAKLLGR